MAAAGGRILFREDHRTRQTIAARVCRQPRYASGLFFAVLHQANGADAAISLSAAAARDRREGVRRRAALRLRHDHAVVAGSDRRPRVQKRDGEWIGAPFISGTLVI